MISIVSKINIIFMVTYEPDDSTIKSLKHDCKTLEELIDFTNWLIERKYKVIDIEIKSF